MERTLYSREAFVADDYACSHYSPMVRGAGWREGRLEKFYSYTLPSSAYVAECRHSTGNVEELEMLIMRNFFVLVIIKSRFDPPTDKKKNPTQEQDIYISNARV